MKISAKKDTAFQPHPATDEPVKGVIVDITPPKEVPTQWGLKKKFRIVYETEVMDEENDRRYCVWSQGYTESLHEKSALLKDLKKILGRNLTQAELDEFDMEALIGMGVKLIVIHAEHDDQVYANIAFVGPDKTKALKPSGKYTRVIDRDEKQDTAPAKKETKKAVTWEDAIVHVGKHKGSKLGDLPQDAVTTLIEKWLPNNKDGSQLANALAEVAELLGVGAAEEEY
jgi:hypothetical protein